MTSQGSAHGRFTRAIAQKNLTLAEMSLREMGTPSLLVALDYITLLVELRRRVNGSSPLEASGKMPAQGVRIFAWCLLSPTIKASARPRGMAAVSAAIPHLEFGGCAYVTLSVPFMPDCACPGTVHE
jgi:hypothetical protein